MSEIFFSGLLCTPGDIVDKFKMAKCVSDMSHENLSIPFPDRSPGAWLKIAGPSLVTSYESYVLRRNSDSTMGDGKLRSGKPRSRRE